MIKTLKKLENYNYLVTITKVMIQYTYKSIGYNRVLEIKDNKFHIKDWSEITNPKFMLWKRNNKDGKNVIFFTLESNKRESKERLVKAITEIFNDNNTKTDISGSRIIIDFISKNTTVEINSITDDSSTVYYGKVIKTIKYKSYF